MAAEEPLPSGRPATTGISLELWNQVQQEVDLSLHSPFVQGIAEGNLDRRAFQHYIAQNAHYLKCLARAYGIALSKALALDNDTYSSLSRLLRGVLQELRLYGAYAAKWGVSLDVDSDLGQAGAASGSDGNAVAGGGSSLGSSSSGSSSRSPPSGGVPPSAATLAYTSFLLEVAESCGVCEVLAAMLPCSRLYGFLGCSLRAARGGGPGGRGEPRHEYWDWVRTYSAGEYLSIPALKEAMFDKLAANKDKAPLLALYRRAMRLEADFFAAAYAASAGQEGQEVRQQQEPSMQAQDAAGAATGAAAAAAPCGGGGGCPPASEAALPRSLPRVLSIAGSDSGGGAGLQADVKALAARRVFAMTAVTALTAQNTHGVGAVAATPVEMLRQQIDAVLGDLGADAVKTGMLPTPEAVEAVAERIRHYRAAGSSSGGQQPLPLVVDPVLVSTSGHPLAAGGVGQALLRHLLPLAQLATPNVPEAEALLGWPPGSIRSPEDMERAARELQSLTGCSAVLVKGGHLPPARAAPGRPPEAVDVLLAGGQLHLLRGPWVETGNTHGTGCTLASAIAGELARGCALLPAVRVARAALLRALRASAGLRLGGGVQRPFDHAAMRDEEEAEEEGRQEGSRVAPELVRRQLRLYAVTDPHCNRKTNRSLVEAVSAAVRGGASMVQLREKDLEGGPLLAAAAAALAVCRAAGVPLLVNDRVDVALAVGADGVHVGQADLPAEAVRRLIGPHRILGVSVKTAEQARAAAAAGADYLGAGAMRATGTKDTGVIGAAGLREVCEAAGALPVVAIGGVDAGNAAEAVGAGCAGIAVVSAIFAAADAEGAARELRQAVDAALGEGDN